MLQDDREAFNREANRLIKRNWAEGDGGREGLFDIPLKQQYSLLAITRTGNEGLDRRPLLHHVSLAKRHPISTVAACGRVTLPPTPPAVSQRFFRHH